MKKKNECQHGFDNANYLRTEPCSFSWDWGPAYAPVGIWRPLFLEGFNGAVVREVLVNAAPHTTPSPRMSGLGFKSFEAADSFQDDDTSNAALIARAHSRTDRDLDLSVWDLSITVFLDAGAVDASSEVASKPVMAARSATQSDITGTLRVAVAGKVVGETQVTVASGSETRAVVTAKAVNARAWWPNGFGDQPLYNITATFSPAGTGDSTNRTVRTGFRKVELVQNEIPGGRSFFFRINGVPVPVKGTNWIPADAFESRVSRKTLLPFFRGMKDSWQNMIRNWGGGIYQSEDFYDLADENGIMIWRT